MKDNENRARLGLSGDRLILGPTLPEPQVQEYPQRMRLQRRFWNLIRVLYFVDNLTSSGKPPPYFDKWWKLYNRSQNYSKFQDFFPIKFFATDQLSS